MTMVSDEKWTKFGDFEVGWDARVLEPRPWTLIQSRWAANLLGSGPDSVGRIGARENGIGQGSVLELCSGVGYLGIDVARRTGRRVVQVERDEVACGWARRNADKARVGHLLEVRCADMGESLAPEESFVLAMADPPYIPRDELDRYPSDPVGAIDGGVDGLDVAREAVVVAARHLVPGGVLLLQLRGQLQAEELEGWLVEAPGRDLGMVMVLSQVRVHDPERAVALIRRDEVRT